MNISARIKELRKLLGLSQEEFGKVLGISRDVVGNIEYDRLKRPEQKEPIYKLICEKFNINDLWLRTGEGNMYSELTADDDMTIAIANVLDDIGCENSVYTLVKELLLKYNRLDPRSKKVIDEYADDVIKSYMKNKRREA